MDGWRSGEQTAVDSNCVRQAKRARGAEPAQTRRSRAKYDDAKTDSAESAVRFFDSNELIDYTEYRATHKIGGGDGG